MKIRFTLNKINESNIVFEIYRFTPADKRVLYNANKFYYGSEFSEYNFNNLTEKERDKYKFATVDQDQYFEFNNDNGVIPLLDVDESTEESVMNERLTMGITYHSCIRLHSPMSTFIGNSIKDKTNLQDSSKFEDNDVGMHMFYRNGYMTIYKNNNPEAYKDNEITNGNKKDYENNSIEYYVVVKKRIAQFAKPETVDEIIKIPGFDTLIDTNNNNAQIYSPTTLNLTIKRAVNNNRLVFYNDKYYYILPAIKNNSNNIKRDITEYCNKLGGKLMCINNWQELCIANYLAYKFTKNNKDKAGYVYVDCTLQPTNPITYNVSLDKIKGINLDAFRVPKFTVVNAGTSGLQMLIARENPENPSISCANSNTNLPFICEMEKSVLEEASNALLKELYENSNLIKFGSWGSGNIPSDLYCELSGSKKTYEYGYNSNGYIMGYHNRHCLLCFLTKESFTQYSHSATFFCPAQTEELDDDCIIMVVSAVPNDSTDYKYDTLSFIIKLNNDQTHCGVPAKVQCALVYNVYLPDQKVLIEDKTFNTRSNWNNFGKGISIKVNKDANKIDIYRTNMRKTTDDDQLEMLDENISQPVISISLSEIQSKTGVDFSNGQIGYGNISQAGACIKNINIMAKGASADYINDLKNRGIEYIASSESFKIDIDSDKIVFDEYELGEICTYDAEHVFLDYDETDVETPWIERMHPIHDIFYNKPITGGYVISESSHKHWKDFILKFNDIADNTGFIDYLSDHNSIQIMRYFDQFPEIRSGHNIDIFERYSYLYDMSYAKEWLDSNNHITRSMFDENAERCYMPEFISYYKRYSSNNENNEKPIIYGTNLYDYVIYEKPDVKFFNASCEGRICHFPYGSSNEMDIGKYNWYWVQHYPIISYAKYNYNYYAILPCPTVLSDLGPIFTYGDYSIHPMYQKVNKIEYDNGTVNKIDVPEAAISKDPSYSNIEYQILDIYDDDNIIYSRIGGSVSATINNYNDFMHIGGWNDKKPIERGMLHYEVSLYTEIDDYKIVHNSYSFEVFHVYDSNYQGVPNTSECANNNLPLNYHFYNNKNKKYYFEPTKQNKYFIDTGNYVRQFINKNSYSCIDVGRFDQSKVSNLMLRGYTFQQIEENTYINIKVYLYQYIDFHIPRWVNDKKILDDWGEYPNLKYGDKKISDGFISVKGMYCIHNYEDENSFPDYEWKYPLNYVDETNIINTELNNNNIMEFLAQNTDYWYTGF